MRGSELIIADDGTLYHLALKRADNIPKNVFLVGDPDRVEKVAKYYDKGIEFEQQNREFVTAVGHYKKLSVATIGTGIGPDNTEIVAAELHALNEYDHKKRVWEKEYEPLNIIRLGTSGSPQKDVAVGSLAISRYVIGLDNLGEYYQYRSKDKMIKEIGNALAKTALAKVHPYVTKATPKVVDALIQGCEKIGLAANQARGFYVGITTSAPGFYAPQGRRVGRLSEIAIPDIQEVLAKLAVRGMRAINNEMETSVICRILGERLGYNVGSICAVLANRSKGEFVPPEEYANSIDRCIKAGLEAMYMLNKK
jgi:uridine phosphorylase